MPTENGDEKILLIEDHPPMRENLAIMLGWKASRLSAEQGRRGLELPGRFARSHPLRLMMPELDGYEVASSAGSRPAQPSRFFSRQRGSWINAPA
jgi:CheY-like chemotaxis protein